MRNFCTQNYIRQSRVSVDKVTHPWFHIETQPLEMPFTNCQFSWFGFSTRLSHSFLVLLFLGCSTLVSQDGLTATELSSGLKAMEMFCYLFKLKKKIKKNKLKKKNKKK
jgi:hypothetical protein